MSERIPTSRTSRFDPLSAAWRLLAAPQTLLLLVSLLVAMLALSTLIPQVSPLTEVDPQAWLAIRTGVFGPSNGVARTLGLFDLLHSPAFHLLLALTGLVLFVRLVDAAEFAWQGTGRGRWTARSFSSWGRQAQYVDVSSEQSQENAFDRVQEFLVSHGYSWTDVPSLKLPNAVAGRRALVLWTRPVIYSALLLALLGVVIVGTWGWQSPGWRPEIGDSQALGHGLPYAIRLDKFDIRPIENGRPQALNSTVTWTEAEEELGQDVVGIGQPAKFQGVTVRQVAYVPEVKLRAWDKDEHLLALQVVGAETNIPGEIEVVFSSLAAKPLIFVPSQDRFLALSFEPKSVGGQALLHVESMENGGAERQPVGVWTESGEQSAAGLRVGVDLAYRPVLYLDYRPGMWLVIMAIALAVIAFAVGWLFPSRMAWIAFQPEAEGSTTVQLLAPRTCRGSRWLARLADRLGEALARVD